jgi:hypothetical protein
MTVKQILQIEIEESKKWLDRENEETTYKRDLERRIDLINWVLVIINIPDIRICNLIKSKNNEIILKIN